MFNYRHPGPRRVGEVGSEPPFMTSFPVKVADPLDPLDPVPCRKVVFRLHETLTFENHDKALSLRPRFRTIHSFPDGTGSSMLKLGLQSYFLDFPVDD